MKSEAPDFTLPGGTISARTFARWIRKAISGPPRHLVGEVIALDEKDIGTRCGDIEVNASTRYQLRMRLEPTGSGWMVCAATLTDLTQKASERTLRQTNPYRLALYFAQRHLPASTEDLVRVREIADEMLSNHDADQYPWALNLSGLLHGRNGRDLKRQGRVEDVKAEYESARDDFERAYRLKRDFSPAYINRGWALLRLGDREGAIKEFNESIKIHKDHGIKQYSDSYNGLGFLYLEFGEIDKAIENFEMANKLDPRYVDRWYTEDPYAGLAEAWRRKGHPAKVNEMTELRECLKSRLPYDLCRLKSKQ